MVNRLFGAIKVSEKGFQTRHDSGRKGAEASMPSQFPNASFRPSKEKIFKAMKVEHKRRWITDIARQ